MAISNMAIIDNIFFLQINGINHKLSLQSVRLSRQSFLLKLYCVCVFAVNTHSARVSVRGVRIGFYWILLVLCLPYV